MRLFTVPLLAFGLLVSPTAPFVDKVQATPAATGSLLFMDNTQNNGITKIQFKISRSRTIRSLQSRGYSDIKIVKRGISKVTAEACLDGDRYRLKVGRSMKIRLKTKIGHCDHGGPRITRQELIDYLETSGYRKVTITDETRNRYTAEACEGRRRYSLNIDSRGAIIDRNDAGNCKVGYADSRYEYASGVPRRVYDKLHDRGFSQISFFDKQAPEYGAEACKNGKRFEITIDRDGRILSRDRIGRCDDTADPGYGSPYDPTEPLRSKGFTDIKIIDENRTTTVVEACNERRRYRLTLDRNGEINRGDFIGRCDGDVNTTAWTPKDVRKDLRARGFNRIKFINRTPPIYRVKACLGSDLMRLKVNRRGKMVGRKTIGTCTDDDQDGVYAGTDIKEILRSRRYYDIKLKEKQFYVAEVCRNARKFRLRIDQFGNERRRKRIGWCERNNNVDYDQYAHRGEISEDEIMDQGRIAPSRCQDYLEWLLQNNSITFASGSSRISEQSEPLLNRLAHVVKRCPSTNVEIAGHTDSDGSDYDNQLLSERRARSVVNYLLNKNVDDNRLSAVGYGETRPIAPNDTPWNKARNRRIEFVVDWAEDALTSRYNN